MGGMQLAPERRGRPKAEKSHMLRGAGQGTPMGRRLAAWQIKRKLLREGLAPPPSVTDC